MKAEELWEEIDHCMVLGCEITFRREGYNTTFITMRKRDRTEQAALPDDHMPESIPGVLKFLYTKLNKKK